MEDKIKKEEMRYYQADRSELLQLLDTDAKNGLTLEQVNSRLQAEGENSLKEAPPEPFWRKILAQFEDFTVIILIVASLISGFTGDLLESLIIIAIVVVNAVLGVLQEGKAEKAVMALKKLTSQSAKVVRDGKLQQIDAAKLVRGDIVRLEAGDIVPADLRLLSASNLKVEEAALTGESVPVDKNADFISQEPLQLGDRKNMLFSTTAVTYGQAEALVVATGENTQIGFIANKLANISEQMTPLQVGINQLGKVLGIACIAITIITFLVGLIQGGEPFNLFMTAVSLAVAAIPEGLPAVVTIVLALGMNRMAKKNAIVKRLLAVETLGSVNVICSDKTGTLTQNAMTVTQVYVGEELYSVTGNGYTPSGEVKTADNTVLTAENLSRPFRRLLEIATLCNEAALDLQAGIYKVIGDPTEGALLTLSGKLGYSKSSLENEIDITGKLPFDSGRKMMSIFCRDSENNSLSLTKGAPDIVLQHCTAELTATGVKELTPARRAEILQKNSYLAKQALRVLAYAYKETETVDFAAEDKMIFVGLTGMIDPARKEAKEAIEVCKEAGIKVKMITGDYKDTAVAIARDLGLVGENEEEAVLTGTELSNMSDEELAAKVGTTAVYARVSPEHKVKIVEALRKQDAICAMTGDGVNDAPALKQADIGVAMGITGTEVAKGAAGMILTDDNFATIVAAVEEGRIIYANIRKFVGFLLSCNIGEILVIFLSLMILGPEMIPLEPIQLLWLNLVTDSFPALALGQEKGERDIMLAPPRARKAKILDKEMAWSIVVQASAIFICVFAAFTYGRYIYPDFILTDGVKQIAKEFDWLALPGHMPASGARTMAFTTLICAELLRAFSCRSEHFSVFSIGLFSNKVMVRSTLLSFLLLLVVLYVPFLRPIFDTVSLTVQDWIVVIVLSLVPFAAGEIFKLLYHRSTRKLSSRR